MKGSILALAGALAWVAAGCGAAPASTAGQHHQPAPAAPVATRAVQPLSRRLGGGLLGVTPAGEVVYEIPSTEAGAEFRYSGIGLWDPVSGRRQWLFQERAGLVPLTAEAGDRYAAAVYVPGTSSSVSASGTGWSLVVLDLQTRRQWTVASDVPGTLGDLRKTTAVLPEIAVDGDELAYTEYVGSKGHYAQVIRVVNLTSGQVVQAAVVRGAPARRIGQLALAGDVLAYAVSRVKQGPPTTISWSLVATNWASGQTLWTVPGAREPAFSAQGSRIFFWKGSGIYVRGVAKDSKTKTYALPGRSSSGNYGFSSPEAGTAFVVWTAETAPWGKWQSDGDWMELPKGARVSAIATGGTTVAWATLPAAGATQVPTIHAAVATGNP